MITQNTIATILGNNSLNILYISLKFDCDEKWAQKRHTYSRKMGAGMPTTIKKVLLLQSPSQLSMSPIILLFRYIWLDCSTDIGESQAFPNFFKRKAAEVSPSAAYSYSTITVPSSSMVMDIPSFT
jgi:hypothetical protein